jgi:hypothetical protein
MGDPARWSVRTAGRNFFGHILWAWRRPTKISVKNIADHGPRKFGALWPEQTKTLLLLKNYSFAKGDIK